MADAREFDLADILSITTGRLISHRRMSGIYDILNYLTGDNLMTHQLPRAAETCRPALVEQHPFLADLTVSEDMPVPDLFAWLAQAEAKHGMTHHITPLATWEQRNPIEELAEMVGDRPIVAVVAPDKEN